MTAAVLVGVAPDGRSAAGVRWAAAEAAARGLPVHLVHALEVPGGGVPGEVFAGIPVERGLRALAGRDLADAARLAHETAPGLDVGTEIVSGPVVGVLRARARRATMLVLGSDGLGPVTDLVLGGIARGVCGHVPVPVVVVPERCDTDVRTRDGGRAPVVVGDDGTPGSYRALRFAVDRAATRDVPLVVVRAGDPPGIPGEGLVAGVDGPPVEIVVARDRADRVLADRAQDAEMVVIGVGDHGWWHPRPHTRPRLVVRATCPVAIVAPVPVPETVAAAPAAEPAVSDRAGREP